MATKKFVPFHGTSKDKEARGMKEGSKREEAMDRRQGEGKKPKNGRKC